MPKAKPFLNRGRIIAVVGVSKSHKKWGRRIYEALKSAGFKTYPVNPTLGSINGEVCYPDLRSIPKKPDIVMTVVPPKITERIVEQCKKLGISRAWMQPGSESEEAIDFCKRSNIEVMAKACFVVDALKRDFGD